MMSLQLYQNASQGPRKSELMQWDLEAEIHEVSDGDRSGDSQSRAGDFDKRQGSHRATSNRWRGKFRAISDNRLSALPWLHYATFCKISQYYVI
jgi:hypothetical protein